VFVGNQSLSFLTGSPFETGRWYEEVIPQGFFMEKGEEESACGPVGKRKEKGK